MRPAHLAAPLILLYWQVGPLPAPERGADGTVHWSVSGMAGTGRWEDATFDCDGNLVSAEAVNFRDVGGRVDVEDSRTGLHLAAAAGRTRMTRDAGSVTPANYSITTYGGQVGWESDGFGVSIGAVRKPDGSSAVSSTLRLGKRNAAHFRMDAGPLSETPAMAGDFRTGVGFRNGYIGLAYSPYVEKLQQVALFGDFNVPVWEHLDLRVAAQAAPGVRLGEWGTAVGLRLHR